MGKRKTAVTNPFAAHVGYQLRRASSLMMADLSQRLGALDLRPADASVLVMIHANPGITQSEIGRILGIQRANMAPLAGGLQARGAIRGEPVDGRSVGYHVTAQGRTLAEAALRHMEENDVRHLAHVDTADQGAVLAWLIALQGVARGDREPQP